MDGAHIHRQQNAQRDASDTAVPLPCRSGKVQRRLPGTYATAARSSESCCQRTTGVTVDWRERRAGQRERRRSIFGPFTAAAGRTTVQVTSDISGVAHTGYGGHGTTHREGPGGVRRAAASGAAGQTAS